MNKLTTKDLEKIAAAGAPKGAAVKVGMSTCGLAAGAQAVFDALSAEGAKINTQAVISKCGCLGMCYAEPLVEVTLPGKEPVVYARVDKDIAVRILREHVEQGKPVQENILSSAPGQLRIVLRNCGKIDPDNMEEYIRTGGYSGMKKALLEMTPAQVIAEMKASGLRGRGGGGFPTALKWEAAHDAKGDVKYMICNGDEGDPGAYMDRSVLEGDPHSVVEGMIIAGYAIGASKGYFYIRAEYPLAVERIQKAISDCYEAGLLGKNILGGKFSYDLEIRLGAGAFVCGEETALIASIEGKRGYPRPRRPYPAQKGLWDKPSCINNVETLANVPEILRRGGAWFASIGIDKSKGTKVFALTGKVKNSGLIEVPMGMPIRDIVYKLGGGTISGKDVKAVQTGGPSGGVIPLEHLDTPISYEHLQKLGSIMGSGGLIVMDTDDCMIDISKFYLGFCVDESCGKCAPCRIGGSQMLAVLERISAGNGRLDDMDKLRELALAMQKASLCGLGQSAPNPVVSTLRYFESEYREHIEQKRCSTGKCRALSVYTINTAACKRCFMCQKNCPVGAISGDREHGFSIDQEKCIKCGRCFEVCKFNAVEKK
ncbi:MAG: NADH-quinone oxidoreductase subunit NuoF [Elusimicrobia bacterium]|nr:NADH-quinone oxidoreductase subunit NuoF [Elusimicrobiota bacterium]